MSHPARIEELPFHSDRIATIRGEDGRGYVVVRRICENLGVSVQGQLEKLKTTHAHWSGVKEIFTPDERGNPQGHVVIPHDRVPMWMATIGAGKVAPELRDKVKRYQCEAADVLGRHFAGQAAEPIADPVLATLATLATIRREQIDAEGRLTRAEAEVRLAAEAAQAADSKADAALAVIRDDTRFMALVGWSSLHGLRMTRQELAAEGLKLARQCRLAGQPVKRVHSEVWGEVNAYPVPALERWQAERDGRN